MAIFPLTFCSEIIMLSRIYSATFIKPYNNGTFEPICVATMFSFYRELYRVVVTRIIPHRKSVIILCRVY